MKLKDLDVHRLGEKGLAFLCPCCNREYLTVFFTPTPYIEQRELMREVVSDVDGPTWIPAPSFEAHSTANENDLDRITIRPSIDARALGHALVTISNGSID